MLMIKGARVELAVQKQEEPKKKKKKRGYKYILQMPTIAAERQLGWQEDTTVDIEQMSAALENARTRVVT